MCCSRVVCRFYSAEPLAKPVADGESKVYSAKIETLVSQISELSLLEVADLNELLKVCSIII